jgi:hypothetical protein
MVMPPALRGGLARAAATPQSIFARWPPGSDANGFEGARFCSVVRLQFVLLATASLLLAGCLSDASDESLDDVVVDEEQPLVIPEPIEDSATVRASVLPALGCGPTGFCKSFMFEVVNNVTLDVVMNWGLMASDFDVLLFDAGGNFVEGDDAYPPGNTASFQAKLKAGEYELFVTGYVVASDTYTLRATFS